MGQTVMYSNIDERIIEEAVYMINNEATIRATARKFGLSKSTVHKDLSVKLYYIDSKLYLKVRKLLEFNLSERHVRGGIATQKKYLSIKRLKNGLQ